ncbi:kinase-like domain-containing protein [Mycena belliarum]|uniref:Kinase-like domain-containing protein n=1 Tax=Mycena belliarum TaxID=1033014 RepID=A0AAD6XX87_9AGAR|nr:kinase-like domain-containing protein [Mycena belliae]
MLNRLNPSPDGDLPAVDSKKLPTSPLFAPEKSVADALLEIPTSAAAASDIEHSNSPGALLKNGPVPEHPRAGPPLPMPTHPSETGRFATADPDSVYPLETFELPQQLVDLMPDVKRDSYQFLGSGGEGTVVGCFNNTIKKFVAIKYYHDSYACSYKIQSEITALRRVMKRPHPHLMTLVTGDQFTSFRRCGNFTAIVIEYHPRDLTDVCDITCPPEPLFLMLYATVALEITSGLNHLHRLGIIHRDIKPDNIMIGHDGHCVIADFGGSFLGVKGVVERKFGTACFSAPELWFPETTVARKSEFDGRADFWSLGATLYDILGAYGSNYTPESRRQLESEMEMRIHLGRCGSPEELTELIISLCRSNVEERLHGGKLVSSLYNMGAGGSSISCPPFIVTWFPSGGPRLEWNINIKARPANNNSLFVNRPVNNPPILRSKPEGEWERSENNNSLFIVSNAPILRPEPEGDRVESESSAGPSTPEPDMPEPDGNHDHDLNEIFD